MTPLLQMLDVSINRSFQKFYDDKVNEWLRTSLDNEDNRTKTGNLKRPSYRFITDVCYEFSKSIDKEMISKSFKICGITKEQFDVDSLHLPLKNLLLGETIDQNDLFFCENDDYFELEKHQAINNWLDIGDKGNSFFKIISSILYDDHTHHLLIREKVVHMMINDIEVQDLHDELYRDEMIKKWYTCLRIRSLLNRKII